MTNFEYYKDDLLELAKKRNGIAVLNGKPVTCHTTKCTDCDLHGKGGCNDAGIEWLYAEHIDVPKLTKFEHDFCKGVNEGYIARDLNGLLYYYTDTPKKDHNSWSGGRFVEIHKIKSLNFYFIKWEDEKPWSIEDLLKLKIK